MTVSFHVINWICESQGRATYDMCIRIAIASTKLYGTRALTVRSETLVTGGRDITQLRYRYLGAFLRFGLGHFVVDVPQQFGKFIQVAVGQLATIVGFRAVIVIIIRWMVMIMSIADRVVSIHGSFANVVVLLLLNVSVLFFAALCPAGRSSGVVTVAVEIVLLNVQVLYPRYVVPVESHRVVAVYVVIRVLQVAVALGPSRAHWMRGSLAVVDVS